LGPRVDSARGTVPASDVLIRSGSEKRSGSVRARALKGKYISRPRLQISVQANRTRMERIGADLFSFVRDNPRPSASSVFYWRILYGGLAGRVA
jgi:hypothetical protein